MQDYRFQIEYRLGRKNQVADKLGRPVRPIYQHAIDSYVGLTKEEFQAKQLEEPRWAQLIASLEGGPISKRKYARTLITQFIIHEGLLYLSADEHDNSIQLKLVVPQDMRKVTLKLGHEKASGHLGHHKTIDCLESYFY